MTPVGHRARDGVYLSIMDSRGHQLAERRSIERNVATRYACASAVRLALLALVAAGCAVEPLDGPEGRFCETQQLLPMSTQPAFDILLVFDRAPSMAAAAEHLDANMRRFAAVLENTAGRPSYRIAAVSSDLGAGGFEVLGCSGDGDGARFLPGPAEAGWLTYEVWPWWTCPDDPQDCVVQNVEGSLAEAMAALAPAPGTCEIRQPFEAARRALTSVEGQAFVREQAYLAIVFISDGDDCSASDSRLFDPAATDLGPLDAFRCVEHGITCDGGPVGRSPGDHTGCEPRTDLLMVDPLHTADALAALKPHPNQLTLGLVAGPPAPVQVVAEGDGHALAPSCEAEVLAARPAVRLAALGSAFPQRNTHTGFCNQDLSDVLTLLAAGFWPVGPPCLSGAADPTDIDPATGIQPACEIAFQDPVTAQQAPIPACRMAADDQPEPDTELPCWWTAPETGCESGLSFQLARDDHPADVTYVSARCEAICPADP
jgi:hypothetical protein